MSDSIRPLTMPKWGLSMKEGALVQWLTAEGSEVSPGDEVAEVETEKILAAVEIRDGGVLRRQVAKPGEVLLVGALLAVVADESTSDGEIESYVTDFQANFVPEAEDEAAEDQGPQTVEVEGRRLRFLKRGRSGDPLVLIHGFGGGLNNWLFNLETLAGDHLVYALDLPGHGASSKDVGEGSLEGLAQAVKGFIEAVELGPSHLVGHSMGGAVALILALAHPELVSSVTLIGSAALGKDINGTYIDGFIESRRRKDTRVQVEKLFHDPSLVTRQMVNDVLMFKRIDGVQEALKTLADQFRVGDVQSTVLAERLGELSMPVLAVWGQEDQIVPASHADGLPQSVRTEIITGAGHMVQMESPAKVNQFILELVGRGSG